MLCFRNLRRDWEVRRTLELSCVFLRVHRVEESCLRGPMFWPGWPMSALSLPLSGARHHRQDGRYTPAAARGQATDADWRGPTLYCRAVTVSCSPVLYSV